MNGETTASELQDRVTELIEQQTAISEVLRAIASSPHDLQPIFDAILDSATGCGAFRRVPKVGATWQRSAAISSRCGRRKYLPTIRAQFSQANGQAFDDGDQDIRVDLVPIGFRVVLTEFGNSFYCASCGTSADHK